MAQQSADDFLKQYMPKAPTTDLGPSSSSSPSADDFLKQYLPPQAQTSSSPSAQASPTVASAAPANTSLVPQTTGLTRLGEMGWNSLARGISRGMDFMMGPVERFGQAADRVNFLHQHLKANAPPGLPEAQNFQALGQNALINPAGNVPSGALEKYGSALAEGAGSALPLMATGGGPLGLLASGAAGEAASQGARDYFPGNKWAPPVAGAIAGGLVGLGSAGLAPGPVAQMAKKLGTSESYQQAGEVLQNSARRWLDQTMPATEDRVWSAVDQAMTNPQIPRGPITPVSNYQQALEEITGRGGVLAGQAKTMRPGIPDQLIQDLGRLQQRGVVPTWQDVRELRSDLGAAIANPKSPIQSIGDKNLSKLYAAITDDLNASANAHGAGQAFSEANATSLAVRTLAEQHVAPLVEPGVAPEAAAKLALAGANNGGTRMAVLRTQMPEAVDELASAHLLQTPQGWARLSPEAQAHLVPDPLRRIQIDNAVAKELGSHGTLQLGHEFLGGQLGEASAELLGHMLGNSGLGPAGKLAGLAVGPAARAAGAVMNHPNLLRYPAAGVIGGNSLGP